MNLRNGIFMITGLLVLFLSGCKKEEITGPDELEISFTFIDDQTVSFSHNDVIEGVPYWDFGNGELGHDHTATVVYPLAGIYQVTLTLTNADYMLQDTVEVTITSSNSGLIEMTADEMLLCGGADSINGKTWVWAAGVPQHMMLAQADPWQWWWGSAPWEKEPFNMYDDLMIFKAVNHEYILVNNDSTYVNVNQLEAFGLTGDGDQTVYYDLSGSSFTWEIDERTDGNYLILKNGGFLSYYHGVFEYKIGKLTENELTVTTVSDNVWWQFMFMSEGFDHPDAVDPDDPVENENLSPAESVDELVDDFETDAEIMWLFQAESGGGSFDDEAANPAVEGINESATVFKYIKGTWEYTNTSMELDFHLDLTTHSRVRMKVYLPSSNTYNPGETGLKQKVSVKLQDWTQGTPWTTQAEVIQEDVALDEWTELVFDFNTISIPADRLTGYFNKILIQFGDEGHTDNGTFYFDDFEVLTDE